MPDYAAARLNMVESQVRPNKVTDPRLLEALLEVPREGFVSDQLRGVAYVDEDVPLGGGRFLMEPMVFARLVQTAAVKPGDTVLEVGCGTGYGAAVLARLAARVVTLESDPELGRQAEANLRRLGVSNAKVVVGPLAGGFAAAAPYAVILFAGAVERVPPSITEQLAEGGRLVAVIAPAGEPGRATLITRVGGALSRRVVFDAGTPVLPGLQLEPGFVF
ncbi:MAG TPA: protein-L-isoaspartate O-methyltransferase [Alphaproteobacteria bacterium]|nr:protein-L-isoaspartate O-methyltransferase [Alphaproteobacteria bacterium]